MAHAADCVDAVTRVLREAFAELVANVVTLDDPTDVVEDAEPIAARIVGGKQIPFDRDAIARVVGVLRLRIFEDRVAADADGVLISKKIVARITAKRIIATGLRAVLR